MIILLSVSVATGCLSVQTHYPTHSFTAPLDRVTLEQTAEAVRSAGFDPMPTPNIGKAFIGEDYRLVAAFAAQQNPKLHVEVYKWSQRGLLNVSVREPSVPGFEFPPDSVKAIGRLRSALDSKLPGIFAESPSHFQNLGN